MDVSKLMDIKFMYWKSEAWPFHVRMKFVQCTMETMILYYLSLLPWTKKALHSVLQLQCVGITTVMNEERYRACE